MRCIVCLVMLATGCVGIYRGTEDDVWFTSRPAGAKVTLDGEEVGQTPCLVILKRGARAREVRFALEGYCSCEEDIDPRFSGGLFVCEFLFTSILGSFIDLATGSLWEYPLGVEAELVPVGQGNSIAECRWPPKKHKPEDFEEEYDYGGSNSTVGWTMQQ